MGPWSAVIELDADIAEVLARTTAGGWLPLTGGPVDVARERYRALSLLRRGEGYVPPPVSSVTEATFEGPAGRLSARVYVPEDPIDAVVVFLHGGGWVIGDLDTHDPICRRLASATRATVASIEYRLAPEAPHPAPSDDAMAGLRWAASQWPDHRLAVAGDSAGGGLAAGCALRCRDEPDTPSLAAQLLAYPGIDPEMGRPSVDENGVGMFLERADMAWFYDHYLPDPTTRRDPVVNPFAAADLSGLAPAVGRGRRLRSAARRGPRPRRAARRRGGLGDARRGPRAGPRLPRDGRAVSGRRADRRRGARRVRATARLS